MESSETPLEQRKEKIFSFFKKNSQFITYALLAVLLFLSYYMRTRNLPSLKDVTTGQYIPIELDSFAFLRYAQYILEHGQMMVQDPLRYYPNGYAPASEFGFLSHVLVWVYKFLHLFNPDVTLGYVDAIYPPLAFAVSLIFLFLLLKRIFDSRVALLSCAFLAVIPPYIYRTMAGFSDKESLGMMFFFLALYLFVCALQTSSLKKGLTFSLLAGFVTGLMGYAWGGVQFLFLTIGFFALFAVLFDYFTERDLYVYLAWAFVSIFCLLVLFDTRFTFFGMIYSELYAPLFLAMVIGVLKLVVQRYDLFHLQDRIKGTLPLGVALLIFVVGVALALLLIFNGFAFFVHKYHDLASGFLNPFGTSRWARTVAESHQPFIRDWFSQFTPFLFWLFMIGSVLFVYFTYALRRKYRYLITLFYALFLFTLVISRYSSNPPFNGETFVAKLLYVGALVVLPLLALLFYLYVYRKRQDAYAHLHTLKREYFLMLIWLLVMLVTARLALRILFVFAPVVSIFIAYTFVQAYDLSRKLPSRVLRVLSVLIILYLLFSPTVQASLVSMYREDYRTVTYSGPAYTQQWQVAMQWVREHTPEDAVFAHWWDYGYWVQGGGQRATLTDGGNNGGPGLNYFMGRNVLTGTNTTEALEFLKAKKATHLLIISDEVGKYGAFSSIGSNATMDRFSTISAFTLDPSQSVEQRNETLIVYRGNVPFDEDVYSDGQLFPAFNSGVVAILVPFSTTEGKTGVKQPRALVVYKGQQSTIPLKCLFVDNREILFPGPGLDACFRIMPALQGNTGNALGAGLYLSRRVWNTLFTHLYLFGQEWDGFTIAYTDEEKIPLALYNGRVFGPLKIWKIAYPPYVRDDPFYTQTTLPDERLR